jgi:class 3 adenylate cyclase
MDAPSTRYAKALDGGYIAYVVLGEAAGKRDVAIVGSIATNLELFLEFEPAASSWWELARFARVSLHDRRGTGLSDDMGGLPDLETRAADLLAVLDAARQERPIILASGDGGMVSALLAATYPQRVGGLVWFGAQARSVAAPGWPYGRNPKDVESLAEAAELGWGTEAFVRRMYSGAQMDDAAVRFLARMQRQACGPGTAVKFIRLLFEYDVRDVLPSLRLPVLVLATEGSPGEWLVRQAEATAALIPGADCRTLPAKASRLWDPTVVDEMLAFCGVDRPPPELDTVLATVLFTDIVGATEQQAALGDRGWKDLVQRHHGLVRESLVRWRGIENDTAGDGFYATFDGPARAVRCAQEIVHRVRELDVVVRAGVHTGECEVIDSKCAGLTVSIGARIAAIASPSQVLVSQTVKDLTAGSGLVFDDHGEHTLKGVPGEWHLYAAPTN